jgi:acetylserotonin N-methyltransferase
VLYPLWRELGAAVRTGGHVWQRSMGFASAPDAFAHIYGPSGGGVRQFMAGMHAFSQLSAGPLLSAFDLSNFRHLVDIGGATGALAAAAVAAYPSLRATVVDLPSVVELAQAHFLAPPYLADPRLASRIGWVAADVFTQPDRVPSGDLFVLSRILHDWDAARCAAVLGLVLSRLPPGGALLVAEMLLEAGGEDAAGAGGGAAAESGGEGAAGAGGGVEGAPGGCGPLGARLQDLNMLVQTHGRERSLAGYASLLAAAGFCRVSGRVTGSYLDAVIAHKPG